MPPIVPPVGEVPVLGVIVLPGVVVGGVGAVGPVVLVPMSVDDVDGVVLDPRRVFFLLLVEEVVVGVV